MPWDLAVGDVDHRTAIQARHGGSSSRGISAPALAPGGRDIMLWWQPEHGSTFGYEDGWTPDGAFYFSGTGQYGDHTFGPPTAENARLRDHAVNGDRVRLLQYIGPNQVRYVCELRLDPNDPWQLRDGGSLTGDTRRVIQFRLLPVGDVAADRGMPQREALLESAVETAVEPPPPPTSRALVEAMRKPSFLRLVKAQAQEAQRAESRLVHHFKAWLEAHGHTVVGLRFRYAPEHRNLRADLFVSGPRVLVEAKASAAREHLRMAIGQLLDYGRFVLPPPRLCVLTPAQPADDMLDLLRLVGIDAAWREVDGYRGTATWLPQ